MPKTVQRRLPGISRKRPAAPKLSEKALQAHIRQTLGNLGYESKETGTGRRPITCPRCTGIFTPEGWEAHNNSYGLPDVFVALRGAQTGAWVALECKKPDGGTVTTEQQRLADEGKSVIVRSIAEAVMAVQRHETDPARWELLQAFLIRNEGRI